jgi:hypothetical protein
MRLTMIAAALLVLPAAARAQDPAPAPAPATPTPSAPSATSAPSGMLRPGMTQQDVVAAWGEPTLSKRNGDWTFLFYRNFNERQVGWMDVVFLQSGQVVDCIARGDGHQYAGQSSSPAGRAPEPTRTSAPDSTAGAVTGVRINNP